MKTTKQIFNYIQGMNPSTSTVSSIGTFVSNMNQQIADSLVSEIIGALNESTLAYKIATTASKFSEKQLWVIAFELEKNAEFTSKIVNFYNEIEAKSNAKMEASKAKLTANKEASSNILVSVKNAGKKLGDYYEFVKSNKKYAREFYSKKFSTESVNEFLSI